MPLVSKGRLKSIRVSLVNHGRKAVMVAEPMEATVGISIKPEPQIYFAGGDIGDPPLVIPRFEMLSPSESISRVFSMKRIIGDSTLKPGLYTISIEYDDDLANFLMRDYLSLRSVAGQMKCNRQIQAFARDAEHMFVRAYGTNLTLPPQIESASS